MPHKILLVEDHELNRDMLSRRLRRAQLEVVCVESAEESLARVVVDRPDLILMDMSLPGMDGWQATEVLKADPATTAIPIIGLSAHDDRARGLEAGCDDYDTKPVDFPRLMQKISAILNT